MSKSKGLKISEPANGNKCFLSFIYNLDKIYKTSKQVTRLQSYNYNVAKLFNT